MTEEQLQKHINTLQAAAEEIEQTNPSEDVNSPRQALIDAVRALLNTPNIEDTRFYELLIELKQRLLNATEINRAILQRTQHETLTGFRAHLRRAHSSRFVRPSSYQLPKPRLQRRLTDVTPPAEHPRLEAVRKLSKVTP